jgi:hypothetical protein
MHLFLFERPAHFFRQLVEKLSHGAVVQIAGVLRQNRPRVDRSLTDFGENRLIAYLLLIWPALNRHLIS